MSKKKILFFITTLNGGGAEKVIFNIANLLPTDIFEITVQTISNVGVYQDKLYSNVRYKTIVKHPNNILGWIKLKLIYHVYSPKFIYRRFLKEDYDIEVAFLEGIPTRIISYSTNKRAKKYAWVHIDLMEFFGSAHNYKSYEENLECYKRFDKIACVSDAVKEKFIERFGDLGEKLQTVYNIVDDQNIKQKSLEFIGNFKNDYPILISCGRLCGQKGFDRLLLIHKRLIDDGIKHYLWIIGEGPLRMRFEGYIKENNLEDTVTLLGFQSNPYKYMKNADFFVCSSIAEGYSTAVTESVILGVPVISTEVAGVKEPVENPRCYKVVENNVDELFKAIKNILINKDTLDEARQFTLKQSAYFTRERYLEKLIEFLGE